MQATRKIITVINEHIQKAKDNQSAVSLPVIRVEKGVACLAFFVYVKPENNWTNTTKRPGGFILADITTGKIIDVKPCPKNEFSSQAHNREYRLMPESGFVPDEDYNDKMFGLLDNVRQMVIEGGEERYYKGLYEQYLSMVKKTAHQEYQVFYEDLSRLDGIQGREENQSQMQVNENDAHQEDDVKEKEPADKKSEPIEEKEPTKQGEGEHTSSQVVWDPSVNLSSVPERTYKMLERISEHVVLLESDTPNEIRFEYPLFCFTEDRTEGGDEWQELQVRLANNDLAKAHFRTTMKDTIFTACANKKKRGCMFGSCPYVAAAYIRFLKENNPQELTKQRNAFYANNPKWMKTPAILPTKRPDGISPEQLATGAQMYEDGRVSATISEDAHIQVQWQESLGPKGVQLQSRIISFEAIEKAKPIDDESWSLLGVDGNVLPRQVAWAIAALCPENAPKNKDSYSSKESNAAGEQSEAKLTDRGEPARLTPSVSPIKDVDPGQAKKTDGDTHDVQKAQEGSAESANNKRIPLYIDKGGAAYQCLNNRHITSFCGHAICDDYEPRPETIRAVKALLKDKGFQNIIEVAIGDFNPQESGEKTAYLVSGIRKDIDVSVLRRFHANTVVILFAAKPVLDALFADQVVKGIYAYCSMRESKYNLDAIYKDIQNALPPELSEKLTEQSRQSLAQWLKNRAIPDNPDGIPSWITWQCILAGRIVFDNGTQERNKGYAKK